jgi:hypothetical protein
LLRSPTSNRHIQSLVLRKAQHTTLMDSHIK